MTRSQREESAAKKKPMAGEILCLSMMAITMHLVFCGLMFSQESYPLENKNCKMEVNGKLEFFLVEFNFVNLVECVY